MTLQQTVWLSLILVICLQQSASAADREFDQFFAKFKLSIQSSDSNSLASMTRLPLLFNGKQLNKAQFLSQCEKIFPGKVRCCLLKEHPIRDSNSYFVNCGEQIYVFSRVNQHYQLTDIDVND